jgi:methyl-accepting chemotaxis protein
MAETVKVIEQIDKKTKVINEIVNKTELLSFNASVEAARAGEHGKGFAVVAEEVGNLARMSGAAAEEIAALLEESINKVNQMVADTKRNVDVGAEVARECGGVFEEIVQNVSSVSGMATEIATASGEQARGCSEITKAMNQLDQMTQQNSATSEEAAASAEELSAQAESLRAAVAYLVRTISGEEKQAASSTATQTHGASAGAQKPNASFKVSQQRTQPASGHVVQLKTARHASTGSAEPTHSFKKAANGAPDFDSDGFRDI